MNPSASAESDALPTALQVLEPIGSHVFGDIA